MREARYGISFLHLTHVTLQLRRGVFFIFAVTMPSISLWMGDVSVCGVVKSPLYSLDLLVSAGALHGRAVHSTITGGCRGDCSECEAHQTEGNKVKNG